MTWPPLVELAADGGFFPNNVLSGEELLKGTTSACCSVTEMRRRSR